MCYHIPVEMQHDLWFHCLYLGCIAVAFRIHAALYIIYKYKIKGYKRYHWSTILQIILLNQQWHSAYKAATEENKLCG